MDQSATRKSQYNHVSVGFRWRLNDVDNIIKVKTSSVVLRMSIH